MDVDAELPFLSRVLLWCAASRNAREAILGDLQEEFSTSKLTEVGAKRARVWAVREALRCVPPLLLSRVRSEASDRRIGFGIGALFGGLGGLLLTEAVSAFVLVQVPLRAAHTSTTVQAVLCTLIICGAGVGGWAARSLVQSSESKYE